MTGDLKRNIEELKEELRAAKNELESKLLASVDEHVQHFKLKYGIAPSEIDVLIHTENVFGRESVFYVAGVRVTIPFDLDYD